MRYASQTEVSTERSKGEIERTLTRYGAQDFASGWMGGQAFVTFTLNNRCIRMFVTRPDPNDERFTLTPTGRERSRASAEAEFEKACRQQWRALLLAIKAKLESIESGIETFDEAFLPHIVLPGGRTVGESVIGQIDEALSEGKPPRLLAIGNG